MRLRFAHNHRLLRQNDGFTLVEMLVVAPIVLIVIGVLVSAMVAMVGDALVANTRTTIAYNTRDALTRIEEDTRVGVNFMSSFSFFSAPQGKDSGTGAFTSSGGDLIITQQATTTSPYNTTRDLVYYKNQPNDCTADTSNNRTLLARVVYFTKSNDDGTTTLWRRVIVRDSNTDSVTNTKTADANTICTTPWQRNTCPEASVGSGKCVAVDEKMLDNVAAFSLTYYTSTGATTTNPTLATSVRVKLTTSTLVAGKTITLSSGVQATRINDVATAALPSKPTITIFNDGVTDYNNPMKVSFQWSATGAQAYSVSTQVNGGAWSTPEITTNTTKEVTTTSANQTVSIRVIAYNDSGTSATAQYDTTSDLFIDMNLSNNWECFNSVYACPSFTRTAAGVVLLRGMVKNGSGIITVLPEHFRPTKRIVFAVMAADNTAARVDVYPDGTVKWETGGTNAWVSLSNIQFVASDAGYTWNTASLTCPTGCTTAWTHYSGGSTAFGKLEYTLDSYNRTHLYGLLTNPAPYPPTDSSIISPLATNYNPTASGGYSLNDIYPSLSADQFANVKVITTGLAFRDGVSSWQSVAAMFYGRSSSATWRLPTLSNSWTNYGTTYAPLSYTKASDGIVTIRGLIKGGSVGVDTVLFTLPAGYRPSKRCIYLVVGYKSGASPDDVAARIDVYADGTVAISSYTNTLTNGLLSLAGINFFAEQ